MPFRKTKTTAMEPKGVTTTKKDESRRVSMLYQQGSCKCEPKVIIKFTTVTMKPTKKL